MGWTTERNRNQTGDLVITVAVVGRADLTDAQCDVPPHYGSWPAVYGLFRRWRRAGVWALILKMLQCFAESAARIGWRISVDSTIMRTHQHAAGARRDGHTQAEPPGGPAGLSPATMHSAAPALCSLGL